MFPCCKRMAHGAFAWLRLRAKSAALRRAIALVCAFAILSVTFVHGMHHFNPSTLNPPASVAMTASDGTFDFSKTLMVTFEHCHGCTMTAMGGAPPPTTAKVFTPDFPALAVADLRPLIPIVETPPPILAT